MGALMRQCNPSGRSALPSPRKRISLCGASSNPRAPYGAPCSNWVNHANKKRTPKGAFLIGAVDGNRTRVSGLGSERSAIELQPHNIVYYITPLAFCQSVFRKKAKKFRHTSACLENGIPTLQKRIFS